jgi:predicted nucleic acid-binding protein
VAPAPALYLLDLSAWARSGHAAVQQRWLELVEADRLICHPVFAIECLHNEITPAAYAEQRRDLEQAFDWINPDAGTVALAMTMQQRMATSAVCGQRVKTADLLIAALAAQHGHGVLHYDGDYDLIGVHGREDFKSEWLAERGSLEPPEGAANSQRKAYRKAMGERMIQLRDDEDLVVWPRLIEWLDQRLRERDLPVPRPPEI